MAPVSLSVPRPFVRPQADRYLAMWPRHRPPADTGRSAGGGDGAGHRRARCSAAPPPPRAARPGPAPIGPRRDPGGCVVGEPAEELDRGPVLGGVVGGSDLQAHGRGERPRLRAVDHDLDEPEPSRVGREPTHPRCARSSHFGPRERCRGNGSEPLVRSGEHWEHEFPECSPRLGGDPKTASDLRSYGGRYWV